MNGDEFTENKSADAASLKPRNSCGLAGGTICSCGAIVSEPDFERWLTARLEWERALMVRSNRDRDVFLPGPDSLGNS